MSVVREQVASSVTLAVVLNDCISSIKGVDTSSAAENTDRVVGQADFPFASCSLCELRDAGIEQPTVVGDVIAVFADRDMVVFLQPPLQLVAVAPTSHVNDLASFDEGAIGSFLAALRRAALQVGSIFGCTGTTITPSGLPQSEGHICFHVIPSHQEELEPSDPFVQAERLADCLRESHSSEN